jgi:hypothetical protein
MRNNADAASALEDATITDDATARARARLTRVRRDRTAELTTTPPHALELPSIFTLEPHLCPGNTGMAHWG